MSVRHRWQAWGELLHRYRTAWLHFWAHREALSPPDLSAAEAEFLPAALALQAQPVSPLGRWVARLLMGLVLVLLVWSILGRTDIIVNASGKIASQGQNKTLAAIEVARVHALHVQEGQRVQTGELLIELDPRLTNEDQLRARQEQLTAELQIARATALLSALDSGRTPELPALAEADPSRWQASQQHLLDQWRDHTARRARLEGEIRRYQQTLPLLEQRARDYAELLQTHDVSRHAWMEKEQARLDLRGQIADLQRQQVMLDAELRKNAQDARHDAQRQADTARHEAAKAQTHGELLRITAPIDGTVQQLSVHTVGGVVPAAQPLLNIVPLHATVEMEAQVENKDIGFLKEGQEAQVKIDAFEYTKYGTLPGRITHISRDAIPDDKRGPLYAVKVSLSRAALLVDGHEMPVQPGMTGSVDVLTGSRRLIEYVLSPLLQHGQESLHER